MAKKKVTFGAFGHPIYGKGFAKMYNDKKSAQNIMLDYQERMFNEFKELNERRDKLGKFIGSEKFNELPPIKQKLMQWQYQAMCSYQEALGERCKCEGFCPITGQRID